MSKAAKSSGVDRLLLVVLTVSLVSNGFLTYKLRKLSTSFSQATKEISALTSAEMAEASASDAPSRGRKDAPVTIVVFSDFQCVYCRQFAITLKDVELKTGDDFRLVVREMPLSIHPFARKEAELATCVKRQSDPAFWALFAFFFDPSSDLGSDMTDRGINFISSRIDINAVELRQCVEEHQGAEQVDRDVFLAKKYGVNGTPSVFINGVPATGQMRKTDALLEIIRGKASAHHLPSVPQTKG